MIRSVLRDKDKIVLTLVIESFVRHGRPVSSGSISQTRRISASSATLRNIMAKLVRYQTSGETTGDYAQVVGYAGIMVI